jgi:glucan phosphoethanolaminetransferase (alkaline phosphatase superfamily)
MRWWKETAGFLAFGTVFCFVPIVLILGAIIQPYSPRLGRWVFAIGAVVVSFYVGVFLVPQALGSISMVRQYHSRHDLALLSLYFVSIMLVAWVDLALVISLKVRKTSVE